MRPRRTLLFIFGGVFSGGGIQRFNHTLLLASQTLEADCQVLSLGDPQSRDLASNIRVTSFGGARPRFARAIVGAVLFGHYDGIVIGHINFLVLVASALLFRVRRRPRTLLVTHGIDAWSRVNGLRRRALRAVDQILCVSRYTQLRIEQQAPEFPRARFLLFPNALNASWEQLSRSPATWGQVSAEGHLPERFLLSVSRLSRHDRYKGIVTVLETLSMLDDSNIHYVIGGDGDDRHLLERFACQLGLRDRVHFLGAVSDEQLAVLYRKCIAFVLPSGKEGFGLVYLEAMYFGAPVVAAGERGVLDVVQHETSGLLVPFGDTVRLKGALDRVIADPTLCAGLSEQGKVNVTNGGIFTFEAFVQRWTGIVNA